MDAGEKFFRTNLRTQKLGSARKIVSYTIFVTDIGSAAKALH